MNKILYHPKEGTTGFFYGDFPDENTFKELNGNNLLYLKSLAVAKKEAINNGEIVNIELLPIEIFKNHCLDPKCGLDGSPCAKNYGTVIYHRGSDSRLKDGDTFDLPEGVKFKLENKECSELCSVGRCAFNECRNLDKVIRLIKEEKEQPKRESQEELWEFAEELVNQSIGTFKNRTTRLIAKWAVEDLQKHFTIQRK